MKLNSILNKQKYLTLMLLISSIACAQSYDFESAIDRLNDQIASRKTHIVDDRPQYFSMIKEVYDAVPEVGNTCGNYKCTAILRTLNLFSLSLALDSNTYWFQNYFSDEKNIPFYAAKNENQSDVLDKELFKETVKLFRLGLQMPRGIKVILNPSTYTLSDYVVGNESYIYQLISIMDHHSFSADTVKDYCKPVNIWIQRKLSRMEEILGLLYIDDEHDHLSATLNLIHVLIQKDLDESGYIHITLGSKSTLSGPTSGQSYKIELE